MAFYLSCTTICSVCTQFNPGTSRLFSYYSVGTRELGRWHRQHTGLTKFSRDDAANGHAGTVAPLVLASSDRFFLFVR